MKRNYICIDWGGSAIKSVCLSEGGIIRTFKLVSENIRTMNASRMSLKVKQLINMTKSLSGNGNLWLIGAAGGDDAEAVYKLKKTILEAEENLCGVEVYSDYLCNHNACFGGENGILSINGTGSVIYGVNGNKSARLGGWGYLLDEMPSGAYFGKLAIEGILRFSEGDNDYEDYYLKAIQKNLLTETHVDKLKSRLTDELYRSKMTQKYMGEFAPVLTDAFENGNKNARVAIERSVQELVGALSEIIKKLDLKEANICGSGGIWQNFKGFEKLVNKECMKKQVKVNLKKPMFDLSLGALVLFSRIDKKADKILKKIQAK